MGSGTRCSGYIEYILPHDNSVYMILFIYTDTQGALYRCKFITCYDVKTDEYNINIESKDKTTEVNMLLIYR